MLSEYDEANVAQILSGHGDWFTAKLMRLIASADALNRQKLFKVYPEVVVCVSNFQGIPIQTQTPYHGSVSVLNPSSLEEWKDLYNKGLEEEEEEE